MQQYVCTDKYWSILLAFLSQKVIARMSHWLNKGSFICFVGNSYIKPPNRYYSFQSYHCPSPKKMPFIKMDPSCTIGFYSKSVQDYERISNELSKVSINEHLCTISLKKKTILAIARFHGAYETSFPWSRFKPHFLCVKVKDAQKPFLLFCDYMKYVVFQKVRPLNQLSLF